MSYETLYPVLKLLHLGSLILWLGPSLGAWWMLRLSNIHFGEPSLHSQFMYQIFLQLLRLEHVAFVGVIGSGITLAGISHGFGFPWLQLKIMIILLVIAPLEIIDIWYSNIRLTRLFIQRHPSRPYSLSERRWLDNYHYRFVPMALVLMPPTLLAILWLAIGKPTITW
ncbi:MAG: DUF2269 domain-containing protein [Gammaproteobacteria bacterium]|nr:DUF2269 domain-containing protein [Gammaproteobacteria bacterium]